MILTNLQVEKLISQITSDENIQRKKDAWAAYECLEDNQAEYVKDRIKDLYPRSFSKFRVGDLSIVKKVIDKKSKAYKTAPMRQLSTNTQTKLLNNLYSDSKFNQAFKVADKYLNLFKYVALWLTYVNPDDNSDNLIGDFYLHALAPFQYDIVLDEITKKPVIFCMSYPGVEITGGSDFKDQIIADSEKDLGSDITKHTIWTDQEIIYAYVDATGHILKMERLINELGILPVAFLSYGQTKEYPLPNNLHKQAIEWNVGFSDLLTAAAAQGHGQLVIKHPEGMEQAFYTLGMHTAISLEQSRRPDDPPTEAEYINANPDLNGQLDVLKFFLSGILDGQGINTSAVIQGGIQDVKSGFDRLLKEADVQDIIEENQSLYTFLEKDIYTILKAYDEALNLYQFTSDDITITFEKPKVLISDKETLENIEKREELGLILPWEKHQLINPNLSDAEAKKREDEIQQYKKEQLQAMQDAMGQYSNTEDDMQDPEENNLDE